MARRFQSRAIRGQRRLTDWIGGVSAVPTEEVALAGQTAVILSSFDTRINGQAPLAPFTIVRTRGLLTVMPTVTSSSVQVMGAYGICVVNGEAFDAGIASIISPWTESFDDRWLYHTYFNVSWVFTTDQGSADGHYNSVIDSKAMRKMELGDVLVAIAENASANGCSIQNNFRTLVKLH